MPLCMLMADRMHVCIICSVLMCLFVFLQVYFCPELLWDWVRELRPPQQLTWLRALCPMMRGLEP